MGTAIVIKKDGRFIKRLELDTANDDIFEIGRAPQCAIQLDDAMISRQHARIRRDGDAFYVEDLGSSNGVVHNGQLASRVLLRPGVVIEIAPFTLEVEKASAADTDGLVLQPKSLNDLLDSHDEPADDGAPGAGTKIDRGEKTEIEARETQADISSPARPATVKVAMQPGTSTILLPFSAAPRLHPLNLKKLKDKGAPLQLQPFRTVIGRDSSNDITLQHVSVSQHHAEIIKQGDAFLVRDLGSSNGTRVNGDLVQECVLQCHDVVEIGDVRLEYLEGPATPQSHSHNVIEIVEDPEFEGVTRQPKGWLRDERMRRFTVALAAIAVVLLVMPMLGKKSRRKSQAQTVNVALNLPNTSNEQTPERDRIIQHQLQQARTLIQREKYAEAKIKVDLVLEKLDAQNLEAKTMAEEIGRVISVNERRQLEKQLLTMEQQSRVKDLMSRAGAAADNGQFDAAKSLYRQVLGLDSDNKAALDAIAKLNARLDQLEAQRERNRAMQGSLNDAFTEGMIAYNAGNFTEAAKLLRQVAAHREHPHYQQASIALDDVEEKLKVEIEEKLTEARNQYGASRLVEARQLLQEVLAGDPKHAEARQLLVKVQAEAREKAQQLYREGYTFEHLVQDYASAKDRYTKVLELLPESSEEYHQKAQGRLKALD